MSPQPTGSKGKHPSLSGSVPTFGATSWSRLVGFSGSGSGRVKASVVGGATFTLASREGGRRAKLKLPEIRTSKLHTPQDIGILHSTPHASTLHPKPDFFQSPDTEPTILAEEPFRIERRSSSISICRPASLDAHAVLRIRVSRLGL